MSAEPVEVVVPPVFESHGGLSRPLTWDDLQTIPDDHFRYELLDGALLVSPAPGGPHQIAVTGLFRLLDRAAPRELYVGVAPYDFTWRETTSLEPDVFVVRLVDLDEKRSTLPPLLAVEVVSPSSRRLDRGSKRLAYEEFGVQSYWVVDPATRSILVLELQDGGYVERAVVTGDDQLTVEQPFAVTLTCALFDR